MPMHRFITFKVKDLEAFLEEGFYFLTAQGIEGGIMTPVWVPGVQHDTEVPPA